MRIASAVLIALFLSVAHPIAQRAAAPAGTAAQMGPCTTATPDCTEWVTLGKGPARSLIYTTRSLDRKNDRMRRALVMVHGTLRNPDHYFATAVTAAFLAGALDDTI